MTLPPIGPDETLALQGEATAAPPAAEPVTRRVLSSTVALVLRSAWERALSLIATLAVARLIVPRELGLAALVLSVTAVATQLVDAGITLSFTRHEGPLTTGHFRAARRVQGALALIAIGLAAGVSAVAPVLGLLLVLDCLQLLTDPLVLQPKVMLQRALDFRGLALADASGVLARSVASLGIAFFHPTAAALVVGDLVAALVIAIGIVRFLGPTAPRPEDRDDALSPLAILRDGMRFQGFTLIITARDLSSSVLIGGLVGLRALGLFQFAQRMLSPVLVIFTSLGQIAVPVGVRVLQSKGQAERQVRDGYLISGMLTATVLAVVAAPAHWLVPAVFGPEWTDSVPLISAIALALVINGPACTFGIGLILAANRTRFATLAAAACAILFVGTLALLNSFGGLRAISIAWITSGTVEAVVVVTACRLILGIRLTTVTLMPIPVFGLAYGIGYLAGHAAGGWLLPSLIAAGTAAGVSLLLAGPFVVRPATALLRAARQPSATASGRPDQRTPSLSSERNPDAV